jgi:hypothetical protein
LDFQKLRQSWLSRKNSPTSKVFKNRCLTFTRTSTWRESFRVCQNRARDTSRVLTMQVLYVTVHGVCFSITNIYVTIGRVLFLGPIAFVDVIFRRTYSNLLLFCFTWLLTI